MNNNKFDEKNFLEKMLLEQSKLEEYYRELRKYQLESNSPIKNKEYYEKRYNIAKKIMEIYIPFCRNIKIHKDLRTFESNRPKIYAVTHIGRYDIEASAITKKEQAIYLWGDPGKLYKSVEKILIDLLGPNFIDTLYRDDCHVGLENAIRYAKNGVNNQFYPEGAWNILPNKLVMRLFNGAVIAAIKGISDLVPCAIQQYGKNVYVSYGKEIDTSDMVLDNVEEETANLRDEMATLAWDIVRNYSGDTYKLCKENDEFIYTVKRKSLPENAHEQFVDSIMKDTDNGYGIEEIEKTRYKDKKNPEPQDVFEPLNENRILNDKNNFMITSNERFNNYMCVLKNLSEITNNLENFCEDMPKIEPISLRLKKYRALKFKE